MNSKKTEKGIHYKLNSTEKNQMQIEENKKTVTPTKSYKKESKQQDRKAEQSTKTSKYDYSFKDLALDNEIKNTTIDTNADILITK